LHTNTGVSLYGVFPALAVLSLRGRKSKNDEDTQGFLEEDTEEGGGGGGVERETLVMPGRLGGGNIALYVIAGASAGVVVQGVVGIF